ncbi:MAG: aldo/keto reductase [Planctomycetaceae bacterium]
MGKWLKTKPRDALVIATKFCGPGHGWFIPPVREGMTGIDRHHIRRAIEASLKRLQTDYIDLYQTHWPDHEFPYEHTLQVLDELIQEGKVRYIGCSNEIPWGVMKSLAVAEQYGTARYESIQNNFSLINRRFEDSLAEVCRRESLSLLPYSPIGGGVLTGKYQAGQFPASARFSLYRDSGPRQQQMARRFVNEKSLATTAELLTLARELNITPATLATAWSKQHDFVASTIIGANTREQLEEILPAADVILPPEILARIDEITARYPYPLG